MEVRPAARGSPRLSQHEPGEHRTQPREPRERAAGPGARKAIRLRQRSQQGGLATRERDLLLPARWVDADLGRRARDDGYGRARRLLRRVRQAAQGEPGRHGPVLPVDQ